MNKIDLTKISTYVNENISDFHDRRIKSIQELKLSALLRKNPYLFRAKNILTANDLINSLLDAFLSSSEEKLFGDFLEGLAIYINEMTCGGHKSAASGVDLEFNNEGIHYLVSIKSGPNWGNSSQQVKLDEDLKRAVAVVRQSKHGANVQPVLGICYGKTKTSYIRSYMKVVGQSFWHFISGDPRLYLDIIEPVGYRAKEHNENYEIQKGQAVNILTNEFFQTYCIKDTGAINWEKLVRFNSENMKTE